MDDACDIVFVYSEPIDWYNYRIGRYFSSLSVHENRDIGRTTFCPTLIGLCKAFLYGKLKDVELYWALNTFC